MAARDWLLLLSHIPPKPLYLRAAALRRLKQLGALPLKRSAYLLPDGDEGREDLEWVRREIEAGGGSAWVFRVQGVAGLDDKAAIAAFREARGADYAALAADARAVAAEPSRKALRRIRERLEALRRIDFFDAAGRKEVEVIMATIEKTMASERRPYGGGRPPRGRLWITRRGVKCDRMASAWLIKRFIDAEARFAFVDPGYLPEDGALRFDMFDGDYTHEGERCTFEVLLARCELDDPGLAAIGEIIHDIDYKEERFARPETAGIALLLEGIAARHADDAARLAESGPLFDALHARLARR